jgi:hypothetical protein
MLKKVDFAMPVIAKVQIQVYAIPYLMQLMPLIR